MIKVTKKEVKEYVRQFKDGTPMNWTICHCCALVRNNKIELVTDYIGQGMNGLLYNGDYDQKINIKEQIESYKGINGNNNIEETTELIIKKIEDELS